MLNRSLPSLAVVGLLLAAAACTPSRSDNRMAGAAQAQTSRQDMDRDRDRMGRRGMMRGHAAMAEHVEGHLAFLRAELKITRAQEPRWNALADAMRAHARTMADMQRAMAGEARPSAGLPNRLDRAERMMTMHRDEMRKISAAVKPLYAALSPAQRRTADDVLDGMMGGPMMGDPRMMGMMRGGPPISDRVEGRLAFLRTELKITPAQEPQWNAFANELRAQSRDMARMHGQMMSRMGIGRDGRPIRRAAGNLPGRLDAADQAMSAHIDALRKFRTAATSLHGVLNDDQRRVFDNLIGPRGGRRMGRM